MDALQAFGEGVKEVRLLSDQDPLRGGLGGDADAELSSALQRGACVLLVSHFEGFLKDLAELVVEVLVAAQVPMKHLPQQLREAHSLPRLDAVMKASDPQQRASLLKKVSDVAFLWNPDAKLQPGKLDSKTVARVITSANAECIDAFFDMLGTAPVCTGHLDVLDGEAMTPVGIQTRLTEIVTCRNDIAHGGADRKVTHQDVDRYTTFLEAFAQRLFALAKARVDEIAAKA